MFAGASLGYWIAFHAIVVILLVVDLGVLQRLPHSQSVRTAWGWTAVLAALAFCFAIFLSRTQGHERGLEFLSGYLVEGSLSLDNLFVFLLMFRSLGVSTDQQHRVLLWGVLGAIVMRGLFIYAGASLLARFDWVQYIFGAFLLFAAVHLFRQKPNQAGPVGPARWIFKKAQSHPLALSSFVLIVLAVEVTDLIFALDSIPAVLAITRDTFIVYTSNIFAILGLRSLYFALSSALDHLRLLHYGLAFILAFVALKMLLSHWVEVPIGWSLGFIIVVLAAFAIASRFTEPKPSAARPQS
jgi:predicted tellurium resistance membrane protein TerC